jgi:hypothetical protein
MRRTIVMSSFGSVLRGTRAAYTRRVVALAPVLVLGGAIAVGCGSAGPSSTTTQPPRTPVEAAFAYARCMRGHGAPSFPDPQVSTSPGETKIAQRAAPVSAADAPAFKAAEKACHGLLAEIDNGSRAQQQARTQDLLAFARCLRAHGVAGFPDPGSQGRLSLQMISAAGVDVHSRGFYDAARACVAVTHGAITLADVQAATRGGH